MQDISEFEVYPFIDVGVEIWMHKILYPSIGYHKDLFLGNEYNINKGVGFYYVWGLYDSVFFRYSRLSSDDFDRDEFLLGLLSPYFKLRKELILVRHAKSSDDPYLDDHDRPLNERGLRNAPEMGKRMQDWGIRPEA